MLCLYAGPTDKKKIPFSLSVMAITGVSGTERYSSPDCEIATSALILCALVLATDSVSNLFILLIVFHGDAVTMGWLGGSGLIKQAILGPTIGCSGITSPAFDDLCRLIKFTVPMIYPLLRPTIRDYVTKLTIPRRHPFGISPQLYHGQHP